MIDHPQPSPFRGAARWIASWLVVSTLTVIITLYVLARVGPPADERPKGEAVVESGAAPSLPSPSPPRQRCVAADHLVGGFAPTVAELDPDQEAAVDGIALAANSATCVSQAADGVGAQSGLDCGDGVRAVVVGHADANPSGRAGGNRALSLHRALAVTQRLLGHGVVVTLTEGRGATEPAPGPMPDGRPPRQRHADDRRVTVQLLCG